MWRGPEFSSHKAAGWYMGKAEPLVWKSSGSRHSIWGASEDVGCHFERGAIFFNSIYSVQLIWKYIVAGPSPATSNFIVLCLFTRFMSIPVVCVNGKHTWILGIFALCKRRLRQCKFGVVVIWLYSSWQWHFFFFRKLTCQVRHSPLSWS